MNRRVGIVVLNWNGGAGTVACIESARTQSYPEKFIVLVDNNSSGAEREQLRRRYGGDPTMQLCFLDENRGYAGGNNAGIAAALQTGAEMVLILTQDAALAPGALAALVDTASANPQVGIVGPTVINARPPQRVLSVGERIHVACICVPRTLLRYRRVRVPWRTVTGVLGCVMLLTRACVEVAGAFDEEFFAYYEEVDLCLRARAHGFTIACTPRAVATHDSMRGFWSGFTDVSAELKARNLLLLMRRWATPRDWLLLVPTCCLLFASSIALYAVRGRTTVVRALVRGIAAGIRRRSGPLGAVAGAAN